MSLPPPPCPKSSGSQSVNHNPSLSLSFCICPMEAILLISRSSKRCLEGNHPGQPRFWLDILRVVLEARLTRATPPHPQARSPWPSSGPSS